jgi:tetratricopeptide (TPR) repeat protein
MEALRRYDCSHVILHRHALSYSEVDTAFVRALAGRGELLTRFAPGGDVQAGRYDPIDAYYVPIGHFGDLQRTGPEIEIWRVGSGAPVSWATLPGALAQAYVFGGALRLQEGAVAEALALVGRGLELDADCADGYLVSAHIMERAGRDGDAVGFYEQAIALGLDQAQSWLEMGNAHRRLGDAEAAMRCFARALTLAPDHPQAAALRQVLTEGF